MTTPAALASHLRQVYFGGNWTSVSMKDALAGLDWQQATTQVQSLNTVAALVYHTGYYISAALAVLRGGPLNASDSLSFNHPPIQSGAGWTALLEQTWTDATAFADAVERLPAAQLDATFSDEKYGSYYRNIQGIIEHTHYHLGQIALLKKMLPAAVKTLPGAADI